MNINVLFWNVRGLGGIEKGKMVGDMVKWSRGSVVGLSETKLEIVRPSLAKRLGGGGGDFRWVLRPSIGASGGLLIGVDLNDYVIEDEWVGVFSISVVVRCKADSWRQTISVVYGPNVAEDRGLF